MTRGRPRKSNPDDVMQVAMQSFWMNGYQNVSLNDLSKLTGMAKPGFYANFGDKVDLFRRTLENYSEKIAEPMLKEVKDSPEPITAVFRKFLVRIASTVTDSDLPNGCFISANFLEYAQLPQELREVSKLLIDRRLTVFRHRIEAAVQTGELPQATDAEALAQFLSGQALAVTGLAKAGADITTLKQFANYAVAVLKPVPDSPD